MGEGAIRRRRRGEPLSGLGEEKWGNDED